MNWILTKIRGKPKESIRDMLINLNSKVDHIQVNQEKMKEDQEKMKEDQVEIKEDIKKIKVGQVEIKEDIKKVNKKIDHIISLTPFVVAVASEKTNMWDILRSKKKHSEGKHEERKAERRFKLYQSISNDHTVQCINSFVLICMITGVKSVAINSNATVIAAHIIPHAANKIADNNHPKFLQFIAMDPSDVNSPRNYLSLVKGIESCFDELKLSFVRDQNSDKYYLVIYDKSCRGTFMNII